jgi:hypothetical protein
MSSTLRSPPPTEKGHEDALGHPSHHVDHDVAGVRAGGDVIKYQLVRAFLIVELGHLHRIADIHVALELDALGELTVAHVQARYDAFA